MPILVKIMGKKRPLGRPASFDVGTKLIRVPADIADMVAWLARVEGITHGQIIDPLVRPVVLSRFVSRYAAIRGIKAAEDAAAESAGREASPPLPQVNVLDPDTGSMILIEELHAKQDRQRAEVEKKKPKK